MGTIIESEFKPAWWLLGGHAQTLWPTLSRRYVRIRTERERIELEDGDFIDIDWFNKNGTGPVTIVLHGLEGSINSPYTRGIARSLGAQNHVVAVIHFRGCSGEHNRLDQTYHSGFTTDLAFFVSVLQKRFPGREIFAVGYSLGGNVLLKWLGDTGEQNPLSRAVAVSVPFLLARLADKMDTGFARIYQRHFIVQLKQKIFSKYQSMKAPVDLDLLNKVKNFWEFDGLVTAPMFGFASAQDYYDQSSCRQFLSKIQRPTLIIHAQNDPFMVPEVIPAADELSEHVTLELSKDGGHVGFISGNTPGKPNYWLESRIPQYLSAVNPGGRGVKVYNEATF